MSHFTFLGREYKTDDFLKDVVSMADLLAKNARIIDQHLPANTDLTQDEQTEIQAQVSDRTLYRVNKLIPAAVRSSMPSSHFLDSQLKISGVHSPLITSARSHPQSVLSPSQHSVKHYPL